MNKEMTVEDIFRTYIEVEKELDRIRYLLYNTTFAMIASSILLLLYQIFNFRDVASIEYNFFYLILIITFTFAILLFSIIEKS